MNTLLMGDAMGITTKLEMLDQKIDPQQLKELMEWVTKHRKELKKWAPDELGFMITLCLPEIPKSIVAILAPDLYLLIQSGNTAEERYQFHIAERGIHDEYRKADADHRDSYLRRKFLMPLWKECIQGDTWL